MEHVSSAPPPQAPSSHTKQYVFVDEYNRHKRLKVMRACDGCRKRKIRCDGALQNGPWPCGACVRLKLKCIPPTLDQDDDQPAPDPAEGRHQFSFQNTTLTNPGAVNSKSAGYPSQTSLIHEWTSSVPPPLSTTIATTTAQHAYDLNAYQHHNFQQQPLGSRLETGYSDDNYYSPAVPQSQYHQQVRTPILLRNDTVDSRSSNGDPEEIDAGVRELSEHMGDLQIDITSAAPYISNAHLSRDAPAVEEAEADLPPSVFTDTTARIPSEMMPSEARAMDYFGYFFDHIHPYCPVLNRSEFLRQWRDARASMSPLLLEAVFACVSRYLEEATHFRKWLALAARHEENFKDVPRLSTIQALIILMKARESVSRRGYYYRSWMTVKYMVTMATDLHLHEHYDQHQYGNTCQLSRDDCIAKTRIWQSLFVLEIMVGAPMGRTDFSVDVDTVDCNLPFPNAAEEAFEHQTSKQSALMAQTIRNIKITNNLWQKIRKYKKDWALDPQFVRHNQDLPQWLRSLPADHQIHFPEDGSIPWLHGQHFAANLHIYHHLVVIMHHRPQLQALLERRDPAWKSSLDTCLLSATYMCRLQEALYRDFQFHGVQFMIRGVNFTIYCVLTCMMLHLAAITCPDPTMNGQGRLYFTRHMRVLEHCLPSSTPEMRVQINALREAFSVDTSQPFELKPTLGLRSPTIDKHSTPSSTHSGAISVSTTMPHQPWSNMDLTSLKTLTPTSEYGSSYDSLPSRNTSSRPPLSQQGSYELPPHSTYPSQHLQQISTAPQIGYALEAVDSTEQHTPVWDPSGIFHQWNTAFGGGQTSSQPSPPHPHRMQPTSAPLLPNQSPINVSSIYSTQPYAVSPNSAVPDATPPGLQPAVTPVMWQDAFTSAYVSGHGQKRYREASIDQSAYTQYTKRRG